MGDEKRGSRRMSRSDVGALPAVVLAMHGAPPLDFPKDELAEFFMFTRGSATAAPARAT